MGGIIIAIIFIIVMCKIWGQNDFLHDTGKGCFITIAIVVGGIWLLSLLPDNRTKLDNTIDIIMTSICIGIGVYLVASIIKELVNINSDSQSSHKEREMAEKSSKSQQKSNNVKEPVVVKDEKKAKKNEELSVEFLKRANNFTGTIQRIKWNKDFAANMETIGGISLVGDQDDQYQFIFSTDIAFCYRMLYDNLIPYHSKAGIAFLYILTVLNRSTVVVKDSKILFNYTTYGKDIPESIFKDTAGFPMSSIMHSVEHELKLIQEHFSNFPDYEEPMLIAAELLQPLDTNLRQQYVDTIVDMLQIMNVVTPAKSENIQKVNEFLQQYSPAAKVDDFSLETTQSKQNNTSNKNTVGEISSNLKSTLQELDSLIGLENVKQQVHSLIKFIQVQQQREKHNLKTTPISYHCVFSGSPGTGKTTVARILAQIYKDLGVLKKGHLIETDRAGLVGEYVGQTAVKTNKVINSAVGGVLFIDEAYSLYSESAEDYGREAIATLLKRMEDERDNLVVVMAGYTEEMKQFIDINPGLRSRFNRYIDFTDYSPDELYQIFRRYIDKEDFKLTPESELAFQKLFAEAYEKRDRTFGNARFVRNVFEKTIERQSLRVADITEPTVEQLTKITENDVPKL